MIRTTTLTVAALAAAAQAGIFSFASDNDHTSFTFAGAGGSVTDAGDATDVFQLLIDDDNGAFSTLTFDVEFQADFTINYAGSVDLGGGVFVHTYSLEGDFGFFDLSGSPVLTATIDGGALTALGGASSWFSSSTILSADGGTSDVAYTWHGADMANYGLFTGDSVGPDDDAAFTLTFLQNGGGSGVGLDANMLPNTDWMSEGSYSGSANFVPAPASALAFCGGMAFFGRRRR